ncbi:beta/gamma crystallin-related protein [Phenylobacterium sp.]|uniref:beta/gamma crystallin-related protein n=1 Tax=Phenylobacterium sp. TaxID=1871053 RepID=UPI0035631A7D
MRMTLGLAALALALPAAQALAQPQSPAPRGSYERQCTDIRMNGQFLSATCRGARGGGQSSINVLSCAGDIGVDVTGALSCAGPGAAAPAPPAYAPGPGPGPGPRPGYDPRPGYGDRPGRYSATLYGGRNFRGPSVRIEDEAPNLGSTGLNDRVGSIQLDRRSGPWIVCADANYRGRCTTIGDSVADTRRIGMGDAISSLRPAR